ncbi:MAG: short-chain dehydrogenase, partial [Chloroflexota bacterium]
MGRLEGKAAVITGAASGMGRATALLFAREGARLLLADINEADGQAV